MVHSTDADAESPREIGFAPIWLLAVADAMIVREHGEKDVKALYFYVVCCKVEDSKVGDMLMVGCLVRGQVGELFIQPLLGTSRYKASKVCLLGTFLQVLQAGNK